MIRIKNDMKLNSRLQFGKYLCEIANCKRSNSALGFDISRKFLPNPKTSQITIFIILGLIFVVGFAIVFFLIRPPEIKIVDHDSPQAEVESCTKQAVEEAIDILSKNGGDISPKGFVSYNDSEISYLCYTSKYYRPCVNQRPLLVEHIEKEITNYITPKVADCFNNLKSKFGSRYNIQTTNLDINTKLQSKYVTISVNKKFRMERTEEARNLEELRDFNEFKMVMVHPIYDFAVISMEIVNQEITFCNFDEIGFMILHPEYDITKFITGDEDIVYKMKDYATNEEFRFAVRSCKLPAGY